MTIDTLYIPAFTIEDVILDKDTGAPLAGGVVTFYADDNRGQFKAVYEITGTYPNYTFAQLPNPMILSAIGTFVDSMGNPVVPYFLPYNSNFPVGEEIEYYYVTVESSGGVFQFARESVPYIPASGDSVLSSAFDNQLSNPQFAEVLFNTDTATYVINFNAAVDEVVTIAPGWDLVVSCPAAGSVTLTQLDPTGLENIVTNPGTLLTINSAGLSSLHLRQRLYGSPNLWGNGFLAATFVAKTYSNTSPIIRMFYSQSNGTAQNILLVTATLDSSGGYLPFPGGNTIPTSSSIDEFPDAYVDIYLDLPLSIKMDITSLMVAFTGDLQINTLNYDQTTFDRQVDHLFHYYKPQLEYKPIPSYLVGWDFPLNPAQPLGPTVAAQSLGANTSFYVWDQTIAFQTVTNTLSFSRDANTNGLKIAASSATSFSIIQYLEAPMAREILSQRNAVKLQSFLSSGTGTLVGTVGLYWTTDASLPDIKATNYKSIVSGITSGTGTVAPTTLTANGTWTQVTCNNLASSQEFILTTTQQDFEFTGFDATGTAAGTTATYLAIVLTFNTMADTNTVTLNYCSLNGGDIATRPAPQTLDDVVIECGRYYETNYPYNTVPGSVSTFFDTSVQSLNATSGLNCAPKTFTVNFNVQKRAVSSLFHLYDPAAGTQDNVLGIARNPGTSTNAAATAVVATSWTATNGVGLKNVTYYSISATSIAVGGAGYTDPFIEYMWTADCRLGVV